MITGLDHIVVLLEDITAGAATYERLLGRAPSWQNSGEGADRVLFTLDNMTLELMAPTGFSVAAENIGRLSTAYQFDATGGFQVRALLENSAGQGTTLCSTFEELNEVLRRLKSPKRAGVALDTCHLFAKGFDFRTDAGYADLKASIEATFGVDAVRAFHLNDAKAALGSHLDRHQNIGEGYIGLDGFRRILTHPKLRNKAFILETPVEKDGDDLREIETLKSLCRKSSTTTSKSS